MAHNYQSLLRVAVYYGSNGHFTNATHAHYRLDDESIAATNAEFADRPVFQEISHALGKVFRADPHFDLRTVNVLPFRGM